MAGPPPIGRTSASTERYGRHCVGHLQHERKSLVRCISRLPKHVGRRGSSAKYLGKQAGWTTSLQLQHMTIVVDVVNLSPPSSPLVCSRFLPLLPRIGPPLAAVASAAVSLFVCSSLVACVPVLATAAGLLHATC